MRLSSRVKSLERRRGVGVPYAGCGGRGVGGISMWINGVEHKRHGGCPRCGRFGGVMKRILLNYESEEQAREAREMWA